MKTTARGSIGWRHAFNDATSLSIQAFSAGNAFAVAGVPIGKDAAVIEAGLDIALSPNAEFGLSYDGQLATIAKQHGFKANFKVSF